MKLVFLIAALLAFLHPVSAIPKKKASVRKIRVNEETSPTTDPSGQAVITSVLRHRPIKAKQKPVSVASEPLHNLKLEKTLKLQEPPEMQKSGGLAQRIRDKVQEAELLDKDASSAHSSENFITDSDSSARTEFSDSSQNEPGKMASKLRAKMHIDRDAAPANADTNPILESMPTKITKKQKQIFENYAKSIQEHHNSSQILAAYNGLKTDDMSAESHLKLIKALIDTNVTNYPSLMALHTELSQGLGGDSSATMLNILSRGFNDNPRFDAVAFKNTYKNLVIEGMRPLSRVAIAHQLMNAKVESHPSIVTTYKKFTDRALLQKAYRSLLIESLVSMDTKYHDDFYNAYATIVSKQMTQEQRAEIFINLAENIPNDLYPKLKGIHSEMQYKGTKSDARYAMFEGLLILGPNVTAWEHFRDNVDKDLDAAGIVDVAKRLKVALTQRPPLAKKP